LQTWKVVANIRPSCEHAFGSATVTKAPNGTEIFWVYGTRWIRDNVPNPINKAKGQRGYFAPEWSGPCQEGNCAVDVFWSTDPQLQVWHNATAAELPKGMSAYNMDVTPVDSAALAKFNPELPPHRWVMAIEHLVPGYSFGTTFLINNGITPLDAPWVLMNTTQYFVPNLAGGTNGVGACPSVRYIPSTGYYYVISGGNKVYVVRSKDLMKWELGHSNGGAICQSTPAIDCTVMPSNWTSWAPTDAVRTQLNRCSAWDHFASDADLTEFVHDGTVSTLLMWQVSDQASQGLSLLSQYNGDQGSYFAANFE